MATLPHRQVGAGRA